MEVQPKGKMYEILETIVYRDLYVTDNKDTPKISEVKICYIERGKWCVTCY